ncbi:MAG TPA: hypothetical protein VG943_12985 [Caulobacterales bacterium]|nr:hypothetical protein [Caulobacterales bacterium]
MNKFLASLALLALAACTPAARHVDLNPLAERYVKLALQIGTHEEGYVDAYYGPPEWKAEADAHSQPVPALKSEADALISALEAAEAQTTDVSEKRRAHFLLGYARAARFRLDMIEGVRVPFSDEAARLLGLRPDLKPLSAYDPVLARIDALVPGRGPLSERVEAFRARYIIPRDKLEAVMAAAIAECRRRTLAHLPLPQDEHFSLELVSHQSWSAYNWYKGHDQSLIQVNTDQPTFIDRAIGLGCHEGYPGHHVQGIYSEQLYRQRGWVEFSIAPLFSPQGPINEGGGNFGEELAFPGDERLRFEQATLYPLAGLDPATAPAYETLHHATSALAGARLTIAQMYLDGQINREQALDLTQRYSLMSRQRAEQSLAFTEHYRSYVINYASGEDLIRNYVTRQRDEAGRWAAFAQIWREPTLPEDLK